jgi:hypothetical protein
MTIHFHHTSRIANALLKVVSRRRCSVPAGLDRRFFTDIGLTQSDIIDLQMR